MKNLILFCTSLIMLCCFDAQAGEVTSMDTYCTWDSWFKYPHKNQTYSEGKTVYVRVDTKKYHDIMYMELYINGKFVRKESKYPYEWAKGNGSGDSYLRHMKPGTYNLKCRIKDKCGKWHEIYCTFYVKGHNNGGGGNNGGGNNNCYFNNPFDLGWCGQFQQGYKVCVYKKGNIKYVRIVKCGSHTPYWYDCHGNMICNSDNHHIVKGCYKVKCWGDCDYTGGGNNHCKWESDYYCKYTKCNSHQYNLYVKVNPYKYQDIAQMELWINGQYVRKESNYPYEWGKGNDYKLKNLNPGWYELKCKIRTKCGETKYIYKKVKVGQVS